VNTPTIYAGVAHGPSTESVRLPSNHAGIAEGVC
jgi:hypothetical protein